MRTVSSVTTSTTPTISMPESFVFVSPLLLVFVLVLSFELTLLFELALFPLSTMTGVEGESFTLELSPVTGMFTPLQALNSMADSVSVNKIKRVVFLVFMVYLFMVWFHPSSRWRHVKVTGGLRKNLPQFGGTQSY